MEVKVREAVSGLGKSEIGRGEALRVTPLGNEGGGGEGYTAD